MSVLVALHFRYSSEVRVDNTLSIFSTQKVFHFSRASYIFAVNMRTLVHMIIRV